MPRNRRPLIAVLASLTLLLLVGSAQAATVTIGYPLTGTFLPNYCSGCTLLAVGSSTPGAVFKAPTDGRIIRWRMLDGSSGYSYKLRVIEPGPSPLFTGAGMSAAVTPLAGGLETFSTDLPIKAGQEIGIDLEPGAPIGFDPIEGLYSAFEPPLGEGGEGPTAPLTGEIALDADIRPAPTIIALATTGGAGGTLVTIAGTDFAEVSSVRFGSAATTFNVVSENQIDATAPVGSGTVPVSVTTSGGTATAAQTFTYPAAAAPVTPSPPPAPPTRTCTVPKLGGKTLTSARKRIKAADCRVGKLTKKKGATARDGEIAKQVPKPGTSVPIGTKVVLTLAP
jgi:IPT/TIG domain/PASTA domain